MQSGYWRKAEEFLYTFSILECSSFAKGLFTEDFRLIYWMLLNLSNSILFCPLSRQHLQGICIGRQILISTWHYILFLEGIRNISGLGLSLEKERLTKNWNPAAKAILILYASYRGLFLHK